jgi:hypothetical protein
MELLSKTLPGLHFTISLGPIANEDTRLLTAWPIKDPGSGMEMSLDQLFHLISLHFKAWARDDYSTNLDGTPM